VLAQPDPAAKHEGLDPGSGPWVARFEWHKVDLNDFPAVKRWFDAIAARPAVAKGMAVPTPP
jgi:GST-like protein